MALVANNKPQGNKVEQANIDPGVYPGYLVQLIDLGLQAQKPYQGKDKPPVQKIMLTYEFADEFMKDEDGNDVEDKPRWISEQIPFFGLQADKAKSTQRYHAFDPTEAWGGDFAQAIGKPCNITVVNNKSGDRVYDNVANVAAMRPKDAERYKDTINPPKVFDLDNPDLEVFNSLPEWIQKIIKENLNYAGSKLEKALAGAPAKEKEKPAPKPAKQAPVADVEDDDVPY